MNSRLRSEKSIYLSVIRKLFDFKDDFYLLSELVHDYIGIVGAVKDAFNERVKAWQSWQSVQVGIMT